MTKKIKTIIFSMMLFMGIAASLAIDYGSYFCSGCAAPMNPIDVRLFISVYVNPRVPLWRAKDTVTICNGKDCVKYLTPSPSATTWTPIEKTIDSGGGYSGTGTPVGGYSLPDGRLVVEMWDYMWDMFSSYIPDGLVFIEPMCTGDLEHDSKIGACG